MSSGGGGGEGEEDDTLVMTFITLLVLFMNSSISIKWLIPSSSYADGYVDLALLPSHVIVLLLPLLLCNADPSTLHPPLPPDAVKFFLNLVIR